MDQELRELLKQIIDDPNIRKAREDAFKAKVKEAKNGQEILKLKLKEIQELRSTLRLYVKDQDKRKELVGIIDKQIDSTENLIDANERILETSKKLGDSFVGIGKAAFEGSGSISAFTDNVKGLGLLGNRLDVNIETFRQLSQSGANFGQSIVTLRTAAADAALPLDDFAALVANNSQNLAALFGSTTQGAQRIAELGRKAREVGIDQLAPLGFTVDEINETLLLNLDSQRRTNILNTLTRDQQVASAINFAEQLDRLAKLTGQQRDELRAQIEQQQSNERFQAALQGVTDETRQRLQAFAATVGGISPQLAEGFQDLIANAGVPVTESALALVQNIPGARGVINDLIAGVIRSEDALVRIRDLSANSIDRFRQATVTGQVEFLQLQGGIIELGRRITDTGAVFDEQDAQVSSLVQNLTTFEQATKVLSSQFQQIETGLLQAFGPALGGLVGGIQTTFGAGGTLAVALGKAPALTAGLITAGLAGKFLFTEAKNIAIIAAGTAIGNSKLATSIGGLKTLGAKGMGPVGKGLGVIGGGTALVGGAAQAATADDKLGKALGVGSSILGGALAGASFGKIFGLPGLAVGAGLGTLIGLGGLLMNKNERQFGGPMDAGETYLVGERGPEFIRSGTQATVTANRDLKETFDTTALETKMAAMSTELNNANKALASMVNGVNTLVAVESRALKAVETTARKDRNQVGLV
jgi:DNA-binding transcriptional MerR regulator